MSSYRSIVLVKQVPDTSKSLKRHEGRRHDQSRRAPAIFNPEDLSARSGAEVKDRFGGTVTVITMGLPKAADALRECLYRGADRVISRN